MPNHTSNRLTLRGSNAEVARFIEDNKGEEESLSFENSLPTPSEMIGNNKITKAGMPDTKWDAYDCMGWVNPAPEGRSPTEEDRLNWLHLNWNMETPNVLGFYTAWSPPVPWLVAVSEKYELEFMLEYADEGGGFCGYVIVSRGGVTKDSDFPWDSLDGKELRGSLGYGHDEEGEEDEV